MSRSHRRASRILPAIPLLLLLLAACSRDAGGGWQGTIENRPDGVVLVRNPEQGAWQQGEGWRVEEELRIGIADGQGPTLFGDIAAVEVDSAGRIWVLDRHAKELRVFDARGKYVRTIGREGEGPGEFRNPVGLAWAPDGTMWIADPGAARYTVVDANGLYIATHPRRVAGYSIPWRGAFGPDGLLYELSVVQRSEEGGRFGLLRFDAAMEPADTILLPPFRGQTFDLRPAGGGFMSAAVPFAPGQLIELDPRGFVWTGITDRYRLAQLRMNGDTVRVVEREAAPVPVSAAERDEALAGMKWFTDQGGRVDASRIPAHKPAYEQVLVDADSGIWVRPARPAGATGAVFDVFDAEGRYQGRVELPGGMDAYPQPVIRRGAIYGVARDAMDVQHVVRARIVKGG